MSRVLVAIALVVTAWLGTACASAGAGSGGCELAAADSALLANGPL